MELDRQDIAILEALQQDGRLSNRDLAQQVGLSNAPCWRRVKRLEQEGYIEQYTALVNRRKVGLQILAFAEVNLDNHHPNTLAAFNDAIQAQPEIQECHSVTGHCDYLLKIVSKDMDHYQHFLSSALLQVPGIRSVNTLFSLQQPKSTRELPVT